MTELAVVVIVAALIQKIIERIRESVPMLDGPWVSLASVVLGFVFAFGCGFGVMQTLVQTDLVHIPWWMDQAITGFGLGAGAGFFADLAGRSDTAGVTVSGICKYPEH
jgi:biotin transporter BioY